MIQIGSDGGLLDRPIGHEQIPIAPAERFDVVIDFSHFPIDSTVTLRNELGEGSTDKVMRFRVTRSEPDQSVIPDELADLSDYHTLGRDQAQHTREFNFTRGGGRDGQVIWTVNGQPFSPTRMDARPELGATEVWQLVTDEHHPVHLHLVQFKILSRQSQTPRPTDAGWKDTIDIPPGQVAEIAVRFTGFRGRYVFHCHNLEHEDMAMMANFEVI